MIKLKRVLVATDFGAAADSALQYGRTLTRTFGGELHVLHVIDNLSVYGVVLREEQQDLECMARSRTEALMGEEDRRELNARTTTATSNAPARIIVEYARTHAIDLIVMGTHGHGPIGHFFTGNVAERVVRAAPCPVLTVHNPEREFVHPDARVTAARP